MASRFRMSDFAMALRLKSLNITRAFDRLKDDLFAGDFKPNIGGGGSGESGMERRLRENGHAAINSIVDAVGGNVIGAGEASPYLGLDSSNLSELSSLARSQQREHSFAS